MSDKNTAGTNPPSGNTPCPVCGSENCPTGFHDNVIDKTENQPATQN
ncbi:MAG TPA: hypothetical protein VFV67_13725 [Actinophytocola sp.]|nr:hypothetical protein [Actinophytocola sp.]HEU5471705.1 hypothetical protein [Actinophytocola sp.]